MAAVAQLKHFNAIVRLSQPRLQEKPLAALFMTVRGEIAQPRRESGARSPEDWLRCMRRGLSRCSSDGDRRQKEGRQSPTAR